MTYSRNWIVLLCSVGGALAGGSSCFILDDPNHCATAGNPPCPGLMVCDPCTPSTSASGCVVPGAVRDADPDVAGCQDGGGGPGTGTTLGETTTTVDPTVTTTVDVDTTATTTDGESTATTGPTSCMSNDDCSDPAAPLCDLMAEMCVPCSLTPMPDAACADEDAMRPLCRDGACVQCTPEEAEECVGASPICDGETGTCVGCDAHDQCDGGAGCNLFTGECLPADAVVTVGAGGDQATLALAVASLGTGDGTVIVGEGSYNEPVMVSDGRVVAFVAAPGTTPIWTRNSGLPVPQLRVEDGTVLIEAIEMSGNGSSTPFAVLVTSSGRFWIDRGRIIQNPGGAIGAQSESEVVVRNSFLGVNTISDGVVDVQGSTVDILYTTIGGGPIASPGDSTAIICDDMSSVTVRNSIIVSLDAGDEIDCVGLQATYSATEMVLAGDGNSSVGNLVADWFTDYIAGDFHLSGEGPAQFVDVALRAEDDPPLDIDGDPRPAAIGAMDYAGADVP